MCQRVLVRKATASSSADHPPGSSSESIAVRTLSVPPSRRLISHDRRPFRLADAPATSANGTNRLTP
jgi:hypothetical protein